MIYWGQFRSSNSYRPAPPPSPILQQCVLDIKYWLDKKILSEHRAFHAEAKLPNI